MKSSDYQISLSCSSTKWHWDIYDDEGEVVIQGSKPDYYEACQAALKAFDKIVNGGEE